LAAGLRPDPLGELKRSPRPTSRNKGALLLRGGEGRGKEGRGSGRGRGGGTCSKVLEGIDAPNYPSPPRGEVTVENAKEMLTAIEQSQDKSCLQQSIRYNVSSSFMLDR